MNKRILSMFLAVVMLILAVPVFALSSLATTEADINITSTLNKNSNWPTVSGESGNYTITPAGENGKLFGDGWDFVGLVGGQYVSYTDFDTYYGTLSYDSASGWNYGILEPATQNFYSYGGISIGYSYTAPVTGTVMASATVVMTGDAVAGQVKYAVLVDGVAKTGWTTVGAAGTVTMQAVVDVVAGQSIAFIFDTTDIGSGWWGYYGGPIDATVTYINTDYSALNLNTNWPTVNGSEVIPAGENGKLFGDGWNFIGLADGQYVPFNHVMGDATLAYDSNGGWGLGGLFVANGLLFSYDSRSLGFSYTAPKTGTVTAKATAQMYDGKGGSGPINGSVRYAVLVDGVAKTDWTTVTAAGVITMEATLDVVAGQTIAFVFDTSIASGGWWAYYADGFNAIVTYAPEEEETEPYTTAWSDSMPVVDTAASTVVYNGSWQIGNKADANSFSLFAKYASAGGAEAKLISLGGSDQWTNGGCYVGGYGADGARALIVPSGKTVSVRYIAEYNGKATVNVKDIAFFATSGKATSVMALMHNGQIVWPANATYGTDASWFYADTTLKAADEINKTLKDVVLDLKQGDTVEFVFRKVSDSWCCSKFAPEITYKNILGQDRYVKSSYAAGVGASVNTTSPKTYDAWKAEQAEGADTSAAAYGVYLQAFGKVTFTGSWSNGVIYPATGAYERVARWMFFADKDLSATSWDTSWVVTESYWQAALKEAFLAGAKRNPWGDNAGTMHISIIGGVQPSSPSTLYTYAYEVPTTGYVSFQFDQLCSPTISIGLGVLVDGYMVWPNTGADIGVAGSYYTVAANTANVTALVNEALKSVSTYVEEGSLVQFVVRKNASWAGSDLYGNGLVAQPAVVLQETEEAKAVITYAEPNGSVLNRFVCNVGDAFPTLDLLATWDIDGDGEVDKLPKTVTESVAVKAVGYYGEDHFNKNVPVRVGDAVQFKGNWTTGGGNWSSTDLSAKGLIWTKDELFTKWDGWAFVGANSNNLWGANGGGMYTDLRFATKNPARGIGAIYTVPTDGIVDLDFDKLMGSREINSTDNRYNQEGTLAYYVSILKNGEVIWPTDSSAYFFESTTTYTGTGKTFDYLTLDYPALPTNLEVKAGDEIAFVANMGNQLSWMLYMEPVVTYTALAEAPEVPVINNGSVTLNDKFAANFFVDVDALPEGATNVGAYVNGEFAAADEDGMVALGGIAAKEFTDAITVQPTYTVSGEEYKGETTTVTLAAMMMQYVLGEDVAAEVKNLAIATLNYAAAAQTYFGYNTENLANAKLSDAQKDIAYAGTYADGSEIETNPTDARVASVYGVKLMLNDTVDVALYFRSTVDLTEGYAVIATTDPENIVTVNATIVKVEGTEDLYKVILTGYMPNAWGTDYYYGIVNTETHAVVSDALCYSIADYCVRMQNTAIDDVVDSMLALYEAARAYGSGK